MKKTEPSWPPFGSGRSCAAPSATGCPPSIISLPLPLARSGRWCGRRRLALRLGRLARIARTKQNPGRVAVEIVHGAADVGQGLAAVGHQRARALVKILRELAN